MHRVLPGLAMAALVVGALVAIVLSGPFVVVGAALLGLAAAVFLILTRLRVPILIAAVGALMLIIAIIGAINGVGTEQGSVDASAMDTSMPTAFLITGLALVAGSVLAARWDELEPDWVGYVGAAVLGLAALFAFVFMDELGGLGTWAFVVGLLMLVALWPTAMLLRAPPGHEHRGEPTV